MYEKSEKESIEDRMAFLRFSGYGDRGCRGRAAGASDNALPSAGVLLSGKSSERFHRWFTGTKLYKKHLEGFVKNRSMTLKTKFSLLIPASCMLLLAFLAMQNVYGRAFIVFLIVFKYVYFFTKIRTVPAGGSILPETEG